jgi:hypothetical protein
VRLLLLLLPMMLLLLLMMHCESRVETQIFAPK